MNQLPSEIINKIMKQLNNHTFVVCLTTSKIFHTYSKNEYFERKYKQSDIFNICKKGDLDGVKFLYDRVNHTKYKTHIYFGYRMPDRFFNINSTSATNYAIQNDHAHILDFLLNKGYRLPSKDLLKYSAQNNLFNIAKYLMENKLVLNENHKFALYAACLNGNLDIIKYILTNTHDKKLLGRCNKLITKSIKGNNLHIIKYFVRKWKVRLLLSHFKIAVRYNNSDIIKYIFKNINKSN